MSPEFGGIEKAMSDDLSTMPDQESDRMAQPVDAEQPPRLPFPVVGLGASAGGLEAAGQVLDAMPSKSGMAFVLIQHLPPDHKSHMAEILGRRTRMPVRQVEDGTAVEPNHVYVIRPGHVLTIRDGRFHLGPTLGTSRAANRPIDDFFKSLAEEQRERAVCVVLSGMGSNGTAGAQAVKAVGGLCIAQDPDTAQFPSMPRHLIDAGYADYIVRPADLPEILINYAGSPYATGGRETDARAVLEREQQHLREILAILRTRTRQDFAGYKKPTLLRRVQRRMGLTRTTSLAEYAKLLRQSPTEVTGLSDDLLIHVTGFFRDPDAWEALRERVIVPLVETREPGAAVRAWVTACSSGEEAYTMAILLVEEAERAGKRLDIKVFATDLAERPLAHARAGVYPGGIESEITPERLRHFFTKEDEVYRVRQDLRDHVVFAPQNVLQDPPFSRLDIVACRNLLIYLDPEVQLRVLGLLHFGLREGGVLFLGTSETVSGTDDLYEPIDKKARIYRRVGPTRHGLIEFPLPRLLPQDGIALAAPPPRPFAGRPPALAEMTRQTLLEWHTPAAVTVDRDHRVLYYHGDTRPYLQQLSGEPTRDLMLLARDGIRGALRAALRRAAVANGHVVATEGWADLGPGRRVRVLVTVSPFVAAAGDDREGPPDYLVISFIDRGEIELPSLSDSASSDDASSDELRRLRGELQSTIEELQTSNEELKASNEEVMSINEELQSANEELETSKEEMQSLNEELRTVNAQLRAKMEEHMAASSDLASLLASTDIAVLFLDPSLRIRRFTPAARVLVDFIPGDVGRPLAALARRFEDPNLDNDCRMVLERLAPIEREVAAASGQHFLRRVTAYRTTDNRIDGVVVAFVDITARKRAEEALQASEGRLRLILESATDYAFLTLAPDHTIIGWSPGAQAIFGYTEGEMLGNSADLLFTPEDRAAGVPTRELETAFQEGRADSERWHVSKDGTLFYASGVVQPLPDGGGFVKVAQDLTRRKRIEDELRDTRDRLEVRVAERTAELVATLRTLEAEMNRRRELARRLTTAQEDERRRVARDLHDQTGQLLAGLALAAESISSSGKTPPPLAQKLGEVKRIAAELGRQVHELAVRLRPTALDDVGLEAALGQLVADWAAHAEAAADFQATGLDGTRLPAEVETALYRVVQEALTNIAKHARAGEVSVILSRLDGHAMVVVEDNGVGFDPVTATAGRLGILGMRERVTLLGGDLEIESALDVGTTISIRIPLDNGKSTT